MASAAAAAAASSLPITAIAASSSSSSPVRGQRLIRCLPEFSGLKIRPSSVTRSLVSPNRRSIPSRRGRRGGIIVCEAQETAVEVADLSDSTWESLVLQSESPVLVEFWAPWCGPCRMIFPVVEELAKEYAGKLKFYKVNTDEYPSIANRYGIRSVPTVMIFKNGEKKDTVIGAVPKTTLTTSIDKFL